MMPNHLHSFVWIIDSTVRAEGVRPDYEEIFRSYGSVGVLEEEGACHAHAPQYAPQRETKPGKP